MSPKLTSVLIANRGEIALRIARTCREMGIKPVATYSDADECALHVRLSAQAARLGASPASESYLNAERILEAAQETGCQAIHPGYGFLAENAPLARSVEDAGLIWLGPPASVIEVMGDKLAARARMIEAGVPVVPGTTEPAADVDAASAAANEIGYPVMLKAAAGGGGKGIRIVRSADEIESAFRTASGEAAANFGDGRLYIEKFLERPRHIEVQILADEHGNVIHLGERECSIQRRHQKLIEECPSSILDASTREKMGRTAIAAARAVDYRSAGTVEFLWSNGDFYFLEMNTRLQVEHPVTEEVYGIDLVEQMLRIGMGEPLALSQEEVAPRGHSIEVRLNAEDPVCGFLPSTGRVRNLRLPGGAGVRVDSALYNGMEITPHYDPMIGKVIATGPTRHHAIERMTRALQELHVGGISTSAPIALEILNGAPFRTGNFDTSLLDDFAPAPPQAEGLRRAAAAAAIYRFRASRKQAVVAGGDADPGGSASEWGRMARRESLRQGGR